ncbi:hypothetical protein Acr_03g0002370 [Actinidia rufa]|uniref:Uncharacterized protein n=1 Tax=Actinidia rufa TaxID=165716 RepID=A0A7J0EAH9_9ERIC|nr:hypothetical protein Acr_03g0002370 [Actinidia rufa]
MKKEGSGGALHHSGDRLQFQVHEFISGQDDVGYGGRVGCGSAIGKGKWRGDVNISFSHFLELTSSRPSCSEMGLCGSCVVAATVNGGGGEVTVWTMEEEGVEEDNNCGV